MLSIGIVYLALLVILSLIGTFAVPALFRSLLSFAKLIPSYLQTATEFIEQFINDGGILQNIDLNSKLKEIESFILSLFTPDKITSYLHNFINFTSSILDMVMAIIISVYMLASREELIKGLKSVCGLFIKESWIFYASKYAHKIARIFYGYFYSQALDACIIGLIITIGLSIIGLPYAPLLGLMVGVMNMIPYFGAIIGGGICVLITLLSGKVYSAIFVAIYILVMQQIDGNIIQPRIVSNSIGVRPIYVLLAITVGGGLIGFWGIFFGVPIMAVFQMLLHDYIVIRNRKKAMLAAENASSETPPTDAGNNNPPPAAEAVSAPVNAAPSAASPSPDTEGGHSVHSPATFLEHLKSLFHHA